MDSLEAVYSIHKDKAVNTANYLFKLYIFYISTSLAVFAPIASYLATGKLEDYVKSYIILTNFLVIPIFVYLQLKYLGYKKICINTIVRMIVKELSEQRGSVSYRMATQEIVRIIGLDKNKALDVLIKLYR